MNKFIYKILREAEDSSDDFFQSKHLEKRKIDIDNKNSKILLALKSGLKNVKKAYNNKRWTDEKEELFLKLFSKLRVDNKFYDEEEGFYGAGFFLLNNRTNNKLCFYSLYKSVFCINYTHIEKEIAITFNMNTNETTSFLLFMIEKYFVTLHNIDNNVAVLPIMYG